MGVGTARSRSSDHFQTTHEVTGTGFIGIQTSFKGQYLVKGEATIRLDTTNADPGVSIDIECRVGQGTWVLIANHTGDSIQDYSVLSWDYVRFNVSTFVGSPFTFRASGYFYANPNDIDVTVVTGTSGPIKITGATVGDVSAAYPAVNQVERVSISIRNIDNNSSIWIVNSPGITLAAAGVNIWEIGSDETYNLDLDDTSQVYLVADSGDSVDIQIQEIKA